MRGAQRVVIFCLLTAVLPTILLIVPLYLRHYIYADVTFSVAESDVVEIVDGVSTIFCQEHTLKMNTSFQAFQVSGKPQMSDTRKHIRLKKSMSLPDDTLEYWGFYLLKGSTVVLSVCSRYDGSRILVVQGERNLRTCGLLDHSIKPVEAHMAKGQGQVRVTFETHAQEIHTPTAKQVDDLAHTVDLNVIENQQDGAVKPVVHHSKRSDKLEKHISDSKHLQNIFKEQFEGEVFYNSEEGADSKAFQTLNNSGLQSAHLVNDLMEREYQGSFLVSGNLTKSHSGRKLRQTQNKIALLKPHFCKNCTDNVSEVKSETKNNFHTEINQMTLSRVKRRDGYVPVDHILDGGIGHGHGGTGNESLLDTAESSVSSFENSLLTCYDGQILFVRGFPPSQNCTSVDDVEKYHIMTTTHEVESDGYYYYIFYSDNDVIENDIHAIFNIHKTTYQYTDYINGCVNKTECTFPLSFWSDETVIVEVPTRDGIEHEDDDITFLISSCYPRTSVYIIFPILVLFLILGCAFI